MPRASDSGGSAGMKGTVGTDRARKRSRTSPDADEPLVGKRARGRPRVDTQDATAADRRRTQIRLAQRAYRQRKETTISSLKQQSSQLHAIIEEMNETFLRYNDSIVEAGVLQFKPELAVRIKQMNENFAKCVKTANERTLDSDEEDLTTAAPPLQKSPNVSVSEAITRDPSPRTTVPPEASQPWGYTISSQQTQPARVETVSQPESYFTHISSSSYELPGDADESRLVRRYQHTMGEVMEQSRSMSQSRRPEDQSHLQQQQQQRRQQQQQQEQQKQTQLPFGLLDLPSREQSPFMPPYIFPVGIPALGAELPPPGKAPYPYSTPLPTTSLSPASTYSYQESTFARRLTRTTLEAAVLLLSSPHIHPAILQYIFKLSLPYLTLEDIKTKFKSIISRGVVEDLDWYATPFLHLGGAGTHYRRRDADGRLIPLKNTWTIRQIGPLDRRLIRLESVDDGKIHDLQGVDLTGFEGEWFDAYDVQGYLEEQYYCRLDARSSFAECLIEDEDVTFSGTDAISPSLSRGSTTSISDASTPPAPQTFRAPQPAYGLQIPTNNATVPNFFPNLPKQDRLEISFDQTLGLDLAPGYDMGFAGTSAYSTLGLNMNGQTEQQPVIKQKTKKLAWVDVEKMIDTLMKGAVCIGRAPGYRRKDVDVAFRDAIISSY